MSVISIQAKLTTEELLNVVEQLPPKDAEKIASRLLHLQAQRKAASLSKREAELLQTIYQEKRPGFQERFDELNAKGRAFTLTDVEQEERLQLVDESEAFTVQRLQALIELAQLRQTTLPALMKQLGIKAPPVV